MKHINKKIIQAAVLCVATNFVLIPNAVAGLTATSGSQCQAEDEGSITSGKLTRSTFGITNKSNKAINVYCPVDVSIKSEKLTFNIKYRVDDDSSTEVIGVDFVVAKNLHCFLAFNRTTSSNSFEGERKYRKFERTSSNFGFSAITSATLARISTLSNDPIVVKCTLRPGDQIRSINTEKPD